MMAYYHVTTRDDLYLRLGRGDISLDGYILRPAKDSDKSLCKKFSGLAAAKTTPSPAATLPPHPRPGSTPRRYITSTAEEPTRTSSFPTAAVPSPATM